MYLRAEENGDEQRLQDITERMGQEKRALHHYLEGLSRNSGKDYGPNDYKADCENVRNYYTRWTKEDVYETKASLKRIRKFEARNRLEPFEVIDERNRRSEELAKLNEMENRTAEV